MNSIPERGSLEDWCAAQIFWEMRNLRHTGRVMFVSGAVRKVVFFDDGRPVWGTSSEAQDRLGQVFLSMGLISPLQLDFAVNRCPGGMKLGAVLVQLKFISPEDLIRGVKIKTKQVVLSAFGLKKGFFFVKEEPLDDDEVARIRFDADQIIRDGIQTMTDPDGFAAVLGGPDHMVSLTSLGGCPGGLQTGLTDDDIQLLQVVPRSMVTIREVLNRSGMPALDVWRGLLYLALKNVVAVVAPARRSAFQAPMAAAV